MKRILRYWMLSALLATNITFATIIPLFVINGNALQTNIRAVINLKSSLQLNTLYSIQCLIFNPNPIAAQVAFFANGISFGDVTITPPGQKINNSVFFVLSNVGVTTPRIFHMSDVALIAGPTFANLTFINQCTSCLVPLTISCTAFNPPQ